MPSLRRWTLLLAALAPLLGAAACDPDAGDGPRLRVAVNGVHDAGPGPLVVPPGGFTLHLVREDADPRREPARYGASLHRWGGEAWDLGDRLVPAAGAPGAVVVVPEGAGLTEGSWTFRAWVADRSGAVASDEVAFAVRRFPGPPPIGGGQTLWIDLDADRDAEPGPDFDADLRAFGLAHAEAPALARRARDEVSLRLLERLAEVYHDVETPGLDGADPVAVDFTLDEPADAETTRICVGGADPTGLRTIGNVDFDPGNAVRASDECGLAPPTGVFPRELLAYADEPSFRDVFDPLRPEAGGVPLGAHAEDERVLAPGFDPAAASDAALARFLQLDAALRAFADAVGSVVAHEAAHALGLVPPGPPGGGLHGGRRGAAFAHATGPGPGADGALMRPGGRFDFAQLAGLDGHPLPAFRPLELAYLRDRLVLDPRVEALRPPPAIRSVSPARLGGAEPVALRVRGAGLRGTPSLRLRRGEAVHPLVGVRRLGAGEARGWAAPAGLGPGVYDLELVNPDGQRARLRDAVVVEARARTARGRVDPRLAER